MTGDRQTTLNLIIPSGCWNACWSMLTITGPIQDYTLIHIIILNTNLWHNSWGFKPKVLPYIQRFLSCMALSVYEVIRVTSPSQVTGSRIRYIIIITHSTMYLTHSRRCHYNSWKYNTRYGFSCSSLKQSHTKKVK